jgi:hypothetical protein
MQTKKPNRILLDDPGLPDGSVRILSDRVDARLFADGSRTTTITLSRIISFKDHYYGKIDLTRKTFQSFIENFESNVYGQKVFIDVAHNPSDGAAATVTRLFIEGKKLRAEVEFTEFGEEAVRKRGFTYLSIDYSDNYTNPETEKEHGPTLFGAGLTIRPRVKGLDPVSLSFDSPENNDVAIHPQIKRLLSQETVTMNEFLKQLAEKLATLTLSSDLVMQLTSKFEESCKQLGDNEAAMKVVMDTFIMNAVQMSESGQGNSKDIKLDFSGLTLPQASGMDEKTLSELLDKRDQKRTDDARKLSERKQTNIDLFNNQLDESEGLKGLSEAQRTKLGEVSDMITADMTPDQVTRLAEHQISLGNDMAINAQLAAQGYEVSGSPRISVDATNSIKSLSETIRANLLGTSSYATDDLKLSEETSPFVAKVLAEFDRLNAQALHAEHKHLAAGSTAIGDTNLPVGVQRTVIQEALSDVRVLELVQTLTDFGAQGTTQIPYETRDASAIRNNGVVYENAPIHRASVTQAMDMAFILPMKLAFLISNEVMHFSRSSVINWDAYARNVVSNARIMKELVVRRLCNEMQRAADAYQAVDVTNEAVDSQLDGATVSIVKTANFPIVRAHQERAMTGDAVGSAENTITVRLDGVAISEYNGSNEQAGGTYYQVINYNMGYVQYVSELGVPVTPPNAAGVDDISYSYATNIVKFDLDNGAADIDFHLNGLLRAFGSRKAMMAGDRFIKPNFALMSHTLNDTISNARQFEADSKKHGTDTNNVGDLQSVKGVSAFETNAPGIDLGDERALIGERGALTYTIAKPFVTGQPFEVTDATTGRPTGQKQAYGEEYSAMKVPVPIRNRFTSVLAFSFSSR